MIAVSAFKEAYVTTNVPALDFDSFSGRVVRYDMLFAMYESTVYRNLHTWAVGHKTSYGLYKAIRNIYNPTYRLVEFWKTMIYGGLLDENAGEVGAIPIITENEGLRKAIATLWKASNWGLNKDLLTLFGASMGDVAIKVIDDPSHEEVYLEIIHPSCIKELETNSRGHVKGYVLEDIRFDEKGNKVKFNEKVMRGTGNDVIFRTYKNDKLFAWNGISADWTVPYGFVPLTFIKHTDVGRKFGWAEIHASRSKTNELDDMASKLHDYIRKAVDPVWLFNFKKPSNVLQLKNVTTSASSDSPEPIREETGALYVSDPNAKAQPLVTDLVDVEKVASEIQRVIGELERDLPELQMDIWTVGGYTTGKALRTARQRVERKVIQRRPSYDAAMMAANGMGVAIGGWRGYSGYEGFNLESYKDGNLKHSIPATRPIFQTDVLEGVEIKQIFWNIISVANEKKLPVAQVLADLGWSPSRVELFMDEMKKIEEEIKDDSNNQDAQLGLNGSKDPNSQISVSDADKASVSNN
jgi:hypothetical protein